MTLDFLIDKWLDIILQLLINWNNENVHFLQNWNLFNNNVTSKIFLKTVLLKEFFFANIILVAFVINIFFTQIFLMFLQWFFWTILKLTFSAYKFFFSCCLFSSFFHYMLSVQVFVMSRFSWKFRFAYAAFVFWFVVHIVNVYL